jgi:hypothetical protein
MHLGVCRGSDCMRTWTTSDSEGAALLYNVNKRLVGSSLPIDMAPLALWNHWAPHAVEKAGDADGSA